MRCKPFTFLLCILYFATGNSQIINTIAGTPAQYGYSGDGGPATSSRFANPYAIAVDNTGNIYIGDWWNRVIRKINTSGIVSTVAGNGIAGYSGDGGAALDARLHTPDDIAFDNAGNMYIAEQSNHAIRKITPSGIITTIAGNGTPPPNGAPEGDGGPATAARLYTPQDITIDHLDNIYIVDPSSNSIRKINNAGIITTIAGRGFWVSGYSGDDGPAVSASLSAPIGIAVDKAGNIYIADLGNHVIRKINTSGIISTVAGNGTQGYSGDGGLATAAKLSRPYGLAVDASGNLYITEEDNHIVRKVNSAGIISTIAGTGTKGYSGDGGPAGSAKLTMPGKIAVDNAGNIYITDYTNHTIRKISACANGVNSSVSLTASEVSVCAGAAITFTAMPINGGNSPVYQWKINGSNAGTNSASFSTNTLADNDEVSVVMVSSVACTVPVSSPGIAIKVRPLPVVITGGDITVAPGSSVKLQATVTGTVRQYQWSPAAGLNNPSLADPIASPAATTTYQLRVISGDGCEGYGKIKVFVGRNLSVPGAFTPNNDGKNELFRIPPGTAIDLKDFSVYNRWGQIVFRTNDAGKGWNGTYKGKAAVAGVYVYTISGSYQNEEIIFKGTVVLIR